MSIVTKIRWRPLINRSIICQPKRFLRFEHRSEWFPAETQGDEIDIPWRKTFDTTIMREQTKLWIKEQKEKMFNREFMLDSTHDDVLIQWKFDKPETFNEFNVTADSETQQGYSKCELLMSKQKTAIFRGNIVNKPANDGKTTYAGFAAMKSKRLYRSFYRHATYFKWARFTHLLMKIRGDGRKYAIVLNTPTYWDMTWHDYYTYPLFTHGGPYWQYHKIPFSKFYKEVHTQKQHRQHPILYDAKKYIEHQTDISSLAISLFDRHDGPFQLEIDFIGVYKDETHFEEFAYETYKMPFAFI